MKLATLCAIIGSVSLKKFQKDTTCGYSFWLLFHKEGVRGQFCFNLPDIRVLLVAGEIVAIGVEL